MKEELLKNHETIQQTYAGSQVRQAKRPVGAQNLDS
jgi:hypothetical protein